MTFFRRGRLLHILLCWLVGLAISWGVLISWVGATQKLPQWTEKDRELLKKGEIVVGASLLVDGYNPKIKMGGVKEEQKEKKNFEAYPQLDIYDATVEKGGVEIPEKKLKAFFEKVPSSLLIDPQRLLTNQETLDQKMFLEQYAKDSKIAIKVYLFDSDQEIPEFYALDRFIRKQYANEPFVAVVYYFLGKPEKSRFIFAGKGSEGMSRQKERKIEESAKINALEKNNPTDQLESFVAQLSISVYWVERSMEKATCAPSSEKESKSEKVISPKEDTSSSLLSPLAKFLNKIDPVVLRWIIYGGGIVLSLLLGGGGWWYWNQRRRFYFVDMNMPRRLGAKHAAGVGAEMTYYDPEKPPSDQRKKNLKSLKDL